MYGTSICKTVLLSSLLTIFARLQKEHTSGFSAGIPMLLSVHLSTISGAWILYRHLEMLPPLLEGLYVSCNISGQAASDYIRTVSIADWIHLLLSVHINTLKIWEFNPVAATHFWQVCCQQTFKPAVEGHRLKSWRCFTNCTRQMMV